MGRYDRKKHPLANLLHLFGFSDWVQFWLLEFEVGEFGHINTLTTTVILQKQSMKKKKNKTMNRTESFSRMNVRL